jgi:malonyl-CoA decarboxylase
LAPQFLEIPYPGRIDSAREHQIMTAARGEGFFERTLGNLTSAWRDVASSAARSVGRGARAGAGRDAEALERLMQECLEARGGEASARLRAAELGESYLHADEAGREIFLETLARGFAADEAAIDRAIRSHQVAEDTESKLAAEQALSKALAAPRIRLLTQFNTLPEGVKFLVDLRADLFPIASTDPYLRGLEADLQELLASWFDVGFLDLRRITWDSPASLLEKLIAYEAVHAIRSWDDLHNRLESDRRLYALFHPRMPGEPLAFIEVALVEGTAGSVQALLDVSAPLAVSRDSDTAIFYSISNTQKGLRGISFGDYLIKRVVQELTQELPQLKRFATLSPIPGFRLWLDNCPSEVVVPVLEDSAKALGILDGENPRAVLRNLLSDPDWPGDDKVSEAVKQPLLKLCARYFLAKRETGEPLDPVARFHLKNGARLERLNWLGDISIKGLRQSLGIMASYRYVLNDIEKNHEAYMQSGEVTMGSEMKALAKSLR